MSAVRGHFNVRKFLVLTILVLKVYRCPSSVSSIKCRILICYTCYFQSSSPFFVYFGFLCLQISSVSNFHPDTRRAKVATSLGSLVQLSCWWGGTLQTNTTVICGECSQWMDHTGFGLGLTRHVLPGSTLLILQGVLQGHCPKWTLHFVYFPGLSHSGSWVLHKGTDLDGLCVSCPSQVRAAHETRCLVRALCQVGHVSYSRVHTCDGEGGGMSRIW